MTMTSSLFGQDDMEALLWGPSSPMADTMGSVFFHPDLEEYEQHKPGRTTTGSEGGVSPTLSSSSLSMSSSFTPPPFYSPPPSPQAGTESDMISLPWLTCPDKQRCAQTVADDRKEHTFGDLDWITERVDLSEFDLDSLIGSCGPDEESPSSPEDLLASLDCPMVLDSLPAPPPAVCPPALSSASTGLSPLITTVQPVSCVDRRDAPSPPLCAPEPQEELEIKSEPVSPPPPPSSPTVHAPPSPAYALDLGSEVDVSACEVKPAVATVVPRGPRIILSLSPTRIVVVLAPKNEIGVATTSTVTTTPEITHSSSSPPPPAAAPSRYHRSRPYPDPKSRPSQPSPSTVKVKSHTAPRDKKQKKMEQNKTAATRYRQKKKAEQEALDTEYAEQERRNIELKEKAESMDREIQYLKELMEEVRMARAKKDHGADL